MRHLIIAALSLSLLACAGEGDPGQDGTTFIDVFHEEQPWTLSHE